MPGSCGTGEGEEPFDRKDGASWRGPERHHDASAKKIDGFVRNWRGKGSFDLVGSRLPALKMTER